VHEDRLARWEVAFLAVLMTTVVGLGATTLARSAYMNSRKTDAGVYFRAAWALRSGESPYRVADDNGWHYHYSPLLASVLMPLADPPPGREGSGGPWMPYPASIVAWYVVNVAALWGAVHVMARAIEDTAAAGSNHRSLRFGRRWWRLRVLPIVVCATMVGATLGRGQVSILMALALAAACAASIRGQPWRAGIWLAGGACLKPFLAVVLLHSVVRRQWRLLGGFLAGLVVFLAVVPFATIGPARAASAYAEWYDLRVRVMASNAVHPEISDELNVLDGRFPAWGAVWYKSLHRDPGSRAARLPAPYEVAQVVAGGVLVGAVLLAARRPAPAGPEARLQVVLAWGALVVALLPSLPTCKPHYFALALLLVQGLIASAGERAGGLPLAWIGVFTVYGVAHALSEIFPRAAVAEMGMVPYAGLLILALGVAQIRRLGLVPVEGTA
jgi:hypothetical protein